MRRLFAWLGETEVGVFERLDDGSMGFRYVTDELDLPISLSLPLDGSWARDAPANFLDGLLPESGNVRLRQQVAIGAASTDPFDLLAGVDAVGALTFTLDESPRTGDEEPSYPLDVSEIAAQAREVSVRDQDIWWPRPGRRARFSLAGNQGKFTLANCGGEWYWPSASMPSTHIFKPDSRVAPGSVEMETIGMNLVDAAGLSVPWHGIFTAEGTQSYFVERFDRKVGDEGAARRLRTEDLTQALGLTHREKYDVELSDVVSLLRRVGGDELCYEWLSQVMVNASVGNADAHAKNYSIILEGSKAALAPMYDVVVTRFWPGFDKGLAMPLNDEIYFAEWLTPETWDRQARALGLDGERVATEARCIACAVLEAAPEETAWLEPEMRDRVLKVIAECNSRMEPISGSVPSCHDRVGHEMDNEHGHGRPGSPWVVSR